MTNLFFATTIGVFTGAILHYLMINYITILENAESDLIAENDYYKLASENMTKSFKYLAHPDTASYYDIVRSMRILQSIIPEEPEYLCVGKVSSFIKKELSFNVEVTYPLCQEFYKYWFDVPITLVIKRLISYVIEIIIEVALTSTICDAILYCVYKILGTPTYLLLSNENNLPYWILFFICYIPVINLVCIVKRIRIKHV